jgi:hypothetical protein
VEYFQVKWVDSTRLTWETKETIVEHRGKDALAAFKAKKEAQKFSASSGSKVPKSQFNAPAPLTLAEELYVLASLPQ